LWIGVLLTKSLLKYQVGNMAVCAVLCCVKVCHGVCLSTPPSLGVVETGLFVNMAYRAYFGQADGTVVELQLAPDWESYISIRHGGGT